MPYAAAVADNEVPGRTGAVDQGVEHGLATATATDQADVAYTHEGETAALEGLQPPKSASDASAALQDGTSPLAATAGGSRDTQVPMQVCTCCLALIALNCYASLSAAYDKS